METSASRGIPNSLIKSMDGQSPFRSPGLAAQTVELKYLSSKLADVLHYHDPKTSFEVLESKSGQLKVLLSPNAAETHHGFKKPSVQIAEASVEAGRTLYTTYGCIACHSLDGAKNHGPTFQRTF